MNARLQPCTAKQLARQAWSTLLPPASIPAGARFTDIIVPTNDSARCTFLLAAALRQGYPLLLVGSTGAHGVALKPRAFSTHTAVSLRIAQRAAPVVTGHIAAACASSAALRGQQPPLTAPARTGTGKSTYLRRHLAELPADAWATIAVTLSARTTAGAVQEQVLHFPFSRAPSGCLQAIRPAPSGKAKHLYTRLG
jgi:hypothetical protein